MFPHPTAVLGSRALSYTTWNPADKNASVTLSNGDKTAASPSNSQLVRSVQSMAGKAYTEHTAVTLNAASVLYGLASNLESLSAYIGVGSNSIGYQSNGAIIFSGADIGGGSYSSFTAGDIIGVAFDKSLNKVWFSKNGVFVGNPATNSGGLSFNPGGAIFACVGPNGTVTTNFGATAFTYTPPTGFTGLGA